MSINVNLSVRVGILPSTAVANDVAAALGEFFVDEQLIDDVDIAQAPGPVIVVSTPYPLIISGFYRWHDEFEARLRSAVGAVAPNGAVAIDWDYPDPP